MSFGRRLRRWITGLFMLVFGLVFVLPVAAILLFRTVPPPFTPLMAMRLVEGEGLERKWVPLEAVSRHVAPAVLASEDSRFCQHDGIDWHEFRQALADYLEGERLRGASTVSMQTAKNVFLWPSRTMARKVGEAYLTTLIEWLWPKRRILEVYLNIAEWGPGIYGIEAAARHHFGKPAARLTPRESALLAAVLPNPRRWSASRPTGYIRGRAGTIQVRARIIAPLLNCL
ncbi:MAG: monofunctional biosynthetic peptidoglycan transglycosylase [Inquilinus sp.]|nr:monofunctional biosynthetic peptidoglycan transglycosylase [Inquilinus sp.]